MIEMYQLRHNYNIGKNCESIFSCSQANEITKNYYNFLLGEINKGYNLQGKAVCKTTDSNNRENYYLISVK